jgi:hypothetical protein
MSRMPKNQSFALSIRCNAGARSTLLAAHGAPASGGQLVAAIEVRIVRFDNARLDPEIGILWAPSRAIYP